MGGYDLDEYEDYEDEGEYQEDNVGEYEEEEEEEEEDRLPTQEEMEYLELRAKLKESIRKKMKKDSGSGLANFREKKNKMPYDNFGSFFGPSQPVIAQRVIQESKSLLENPHLAERVPKAKNILPQQNKGSSSAPTGSKPRPNEAPRKVDTWAKPKAKIQMLKNTRDYSFLLSDDAELPIPPKNPPKPSSAPKPDAHVSPRPPVNNGGRKVINGREERRPGPTSNQTRVRPPPPGQQQSQRPSGSSKMTSSSLDSRKQLGSGPGRPSGQKPAMPSKMPPVAAKQKVIPPPVSRSIPTGHNHRPQTSNSRPLPPVTQKKPLDQKRGLQLQSQSQSQQRRDDRGYENRRVDDRDRDRDRDRGGLGLQSSKGNVVRKPILSSKPQMKQQQQARLSTSGQQRERAQKRPSRPFEDDDDDDTAKAFSMMRSMLKYNPKNYHGDDDDDSDMEAGFDDIMREEKRSAWIAKKEDEEELKKIEEEERRERMRKKRKQSQR
ncbi:uncharacterized protein LOC111904406 [Lactuca sativa]|uniref:Protein SPT2 homolog n=1 Tax=Lactuca sativa TaxID=4236 RepID=A0A9R1UVB3_LACSA|nr:uncharacterized protein LOC111904406 [Lactuca sativa]KAJ0193919.1 hypothetical protein LSAT_V11C800403080 [Lactuca sativa]